MELHVWSNPTHQELRENEALLLSNLREDDPTLYRIPVSPDEHSALARRVEAAQREKHWSEPYYDRMAEKRRFDAPIGAVCLCAVLTLSFLAWVAQYVGWRWTLAGFVIFAVRFYCWLFPPKD